MHHKTFIIHLPNKKLIHMLSCIIGSDVSSMLGFTSLPSSLATSQFFDPPAIGFGVSTPSVPITHGDFDLGLPVLMYVQLLFISGLSFSLYSSLFYFTFHHFVCSSSAQYLLFLLNLNFFPSAAGTKN
jgi:hypothetical protein